MDMFLKKRVGPLIAFILITAPVTVLAASAAMKDTLGPNEKIKVSEILRSKNGQYTLAMQKDGNLVAYDGQSKAIWSSDTSGSGAVDCVLQADGNLMLKDRNGRAVWATYTDGHKNARLAMQDDGNLVIYNERGSAVWANGSIINSLSGGGSLSTAEFIRSQNRRYTLVLQADGNLVVFDGQRKALWNSQTVGSGAVEFVLQHDGNLLLKDGNKRIVWATDTGGHPNAKLVMQDDGNVVLYTAEGAPLWSNGNINPGIPRETAPAGPPAEALGQDDAGSGRDAGNVLDEAVPIYPVTRPADGELSPTDNIDFFSIPLDKEWKLTLQLTVVSDQDYDLALLDPDGNIHASSSRGMGQSESLDFLAPSARTYYVRVSRKAGQGRYRIVLSFHKQGS